VQYPDRPDISIGRVKDESEWRVLVFPGSSGVFTNFTIGEPLTYNFGGGWLDELDGAGWIVTVQYGKLDAILSRGYWTDLLSGTARLVSCIGAAIALCVGIVLALLERHRQTKRGLLPLARESLTGATSNLAGAAAYLLWFLSGDILLGTKPYNTDPFVRFHAFQSIFPTVLYIVYLVVRGALFWAFSSVPDSSFQSSLIDIGSGLMRLAFFLLLLFMMYKAYRNKRFSLPFIGALAAKLAGSEAPGEVTVERKNA
jgi:uncharacterized membrane protein